MFLSPLDFSGNTEHENSECKLRLDCVSTFVPQEHGIVYVLIFWALWILVDNFKGCMQLPTLEKDHYKKYIAEVNFIFNTLAEHWIISLYGCTTLRLGT